MKTVINERQRGLKFVKGKFKGVVYPGKYVTFGSTQIVPLSIDTYATTALCPVNLLLENKRLSNEVTVIDVDDKMLALHFVDGKFRDIIGSGKYLYWNVAGEHTFIMADITTPDVATDIPEYVFALIPPYRYIKADVKQHEKGLVFYNNKLVKVLDGGTYYFWKNDVNVEVKLVDTRLKKLDIIGQEMLTRDKVTLRLNFVCNYKITDYIKIISEVENYEEQIHVAAQLVLRDYIGKHTLDEILENKEAISSAVFTGLKSKEAEFLVEIKSADVKDIILPGEIREIMNTVLVAEKKAQANVITRREEVASTRSLLNTAKLMEENPTLYKLKELEYIEKICENVGCINVGGAENLLTSLGKVIGNK